MFLNLGKLFADLQESLAGARRMFGLLDMPEEPKRYECNEIDHSRDMVALAGVTFGYQAREMVINNLDLKITDGQTVAIVGRSGTGKSTLFKLLLGLYPPVSGTYILNGRPLSDYTLRDLRNQYAYVPQAPSLFDGTIEENIRHGSAAASEEEIISAAQAAFVHDFIVDLPDGYKSHVGEEGTRLSGGQKQRIALARAFLRDAPILLLDEVTSALDSESEQYIQNSIDVLLKHRTTIIIAHRISTVEKADVVYVIDGGRIIKSMSSEELLAQKGRYSELYNLY